MNLRLPLVLAALLLVLSGCSRESQKAKSQQAADRWYASGDLDKAEVEYLNILKAEPGNPHAVARLGVIFSEQGRTAPAIAYLRKGSELLPEDLDVELKLAQLDFATGEFEEARRRANHVLDRRPLDPEAPLILATTIGKPTEIDAIRARLLALPAPAPSGAPVLLALGTIEFRQGHLAQAEEKFKAALAADPKLPAVHSALASLLLARKDTAGARAELKQAADLSPPRSIRRLQYAQFLLSQADIPAAKLVLDEMNRQTPDFLPAWVTRAEVAVMEKDYPGAEKLINRALDRDGTNIDARILSGRVNLALGRNAEAVTIFEKLADNYGGLPNVQFELGRAQAAAGDNAKAVVALEQAVKLAPTQAEAVLLFANLQMRRGELSAAITSLRRLLQTRREIAPAWILLAECFRLQGNLPEALAIYRELEKQAPENPQINFLLGQTLAQQGKRADARAAFLKAQKGVPDDSAVLENLVNLDLADAHPADARQRVETEMARNPKLAGPGQLLLAKVYLAQNDFANAEIALRKAVELMPENQSAYFLLAGVYNRTNQIPKALAQLEQAVARNPKDASAWMIIGMLKEQLQDFTAARTAYEKVIALNPRQGAALNNLAYLYAEKFQELDKALELAQTARQVGPDEPHVADTLGWILVQKRQYPRAVGLLQEAAGKLPESAEVRYHLGLAHYMMDQETEARTVLEKALELGSSFAGADDARRALAVLKIDVTAPGAATALEQALAVRKDDPVALIRRAALFEREGRRDDAIRTLESARTVNAQNPSVLASLARLYAAGNDKAKAIELAREARKLAPDDAAIAHSLGRLAYELGDYPWAASLLQEALRKGTPSPDLQFDAALSAYSVGRVDDAETGLKEAVQAPGLFLRAGEAKRMLALIAAAKDPADAAKAGAEANASLAKDATDVPALMVSGAVSEGQGNIAAARSAYEKALARFADFSPAKLRLAVLAANAGTFDQKSYDLGLQARTVYPANAELARALGILTFRKGDFTRAVTLLRESAASRDRDAELQYFLGQAQSKLNQKKEARQSLQRALDLGLQGEAATEARRILAEN